MVLPVLSMDTLRAWKNGGQRFDAKDLLIVDNSPGGPLRLSGFPGILHWSGANIGVAASWNVGARRVIEEGRDWLVLCSTSARFGRYGGLDFIGALDAWLDAPEIPVGLCCWEMGWHFIAIHRSTLDAAGLFDENFYPGYFEETDYLYRLGLEGLDSPRENGRPWPFVRCEAEYGAQASSLTSGLVEVQFGALSGYYRLKWGGDPGEERFQHPFNRDELPTCWWPHRAAPDAPPPVAVA
jgi:hypothetical protein